jgi:epoxyqueuosine reductase
MQGSDLAKVLFESAQAEGFPLVGAVDIDRAAEQFPQHLARYDQWLFQGYAGTMDYLSRGRDRRADPRVVFPGAESVLCVAIPYDPRPVGGGSGAKYARYLRRGDYHREVAGMLERALERAAREIPFGWKVCVDTSAVLERSWAALAGLGWIGKNTLLIHPQHGSYLFLGEALIDRKLGLGPEPLPDYCGHCNRCLDGCPTEAFVEPKVLDSNRCISYWTLEQKTDRPLTSPDRERAGTWVAGCDICQEVCPFNRRAAQAAQGMPVDDPVALLADWELLLLETEEEYRARVRESSLKRVKPAQFARNLAVAFSNAVSETPIAERRSTFAGVLPALRARLARETEPELRSIWHRTLVFLE